MKIIRVENYRDYLGEALGFVEQILCTDETIYCGLSGGSTPRDLYEAMNRSVLLKLEQVHFYLMDERYVPWNNEKSNYKMVRESLLKGFKADNFFDFDCSLERQMAAQKYAAELDSIPNKSLDLAILGVGPDGHFASIFPGFEHFDSAEKVFLTETDKFDVKERLTLSPNFILKAKKILILLNGEEKMPVLKELATGSKWAMEFPAAIFDGHSDVTVIYCKEKKL